MMRMLLNGYGGFAAIGGFPIMMTSFSLSMNEKMIESEGISDYLYPHAYGEQIRFRKYRFGALRDYPEYQISISCELTFDLYCQTLSWIENNFDNKIPVYFINKSTGLYYYFTDCYLMSFTLDVGNNSVATGTYSFMSFQDTIEVELYNGNYKDGNVAPSSFVGTSLMPYWAFGIWYMNVSCPESVQSESNDVLDFSMSYERSITPKYGCFGLSSANALAPYRLVIGIPTLSIDFTRVVGDYLHIQPYLISSKEAGFSEYIMQIHYTKVRSENLYSSGGNASNTGIADKGFQLTRCYLTSYALTAGDGNTVDKIRMTGSCYGQLRTTF